MYITTVALSIVISSTDSGGSSWCSALRKPMTSRILLTQSKAIIINGFVTNI